MDRYETHIIRCLENAVENAVDGVECHIDAVTVQGVIDLLNEKIEQIEKLSKNSMNLKELWEKARNGESLTENEHKFLLADWDERNGYKQHKDGDGDG